MIDPRRIVALEQIVITIVGVSLTIMAAGLREPYVFATLVDQAPALWDVTFTLAGLSCLWWALRPRSLAAYAASSVLVILAASSRLMAFLWLTERPSWAPAAGWAVILGLVFYAWPRMWEDLRYGRG